MKEDKIGKEFITNQGCKITLIEYVNWHNCTIEFENGVRLNGISLSNINKGEVKNPYFPYNSGVGYLGVGEHRGRNSKMYARWSGMLSRCYDENSLEKYQTYKDITVCEEWHNFQNFAKWYVDNFKSHMDSNWHLDKDILVKGSKVYSPKTCCFVPEEINNLFIKKQKSKGEYPIGVSYNTKMKKYETRVYSKDTLIFQKFFDTVEESFQAYKIEKEKYIKIIANKWKSQITPETYKSMCEHIIEITD